MSTSNPEDGREPAQNEPLQARIDLELIAAIIAAEDFVPYELRDRVVTQRAAVIPTLLAMARGDEQVEASEWARIHAVDMLRDINDPATIEPLLQLLARTSRYDALHAQLMFTLSAMGAPVLEPALAAHATSDDPAFLGAIALILARLGVRDERIIPLLLEYLAAEPDDGAICLADYGDPRAIDHLRSAFDQYDPERADSPHHAEHVLFAIESSLKRLGSDLSPEQRLKYQEIDEAIMGAEMAREAMIRAKATKEARLAGKKQRARSKSKRKQQKASRKKNR